MAVQCECTICGKKFRSKETIVICPSCLESDNNVFRVVRDFLYENQGSSVNQVTKGTGLPVTTILKLLRDGRIETTGKVKLIQCEQCGVPIDFGRFCDSCDKANTHKIISTAKTNTTHSKHTMYTSRKK